MSTHEPGTMELVHTVLQSRLPDDHVFKNGMTMRDLRAAVDAACTRMEQRTRSRFNCRYVRQLMQERYPTLAAALDRAVDES